MKAFKRLILIGAAGLLTASQATAQVIDLAEVAFNVNGAVTDYLVPTSAVAPGGVDLTGFHTDTGLGTISVTISGVGNQYFGLFLDHEIDQGTNTWYNEYGSTSGAAATGQSWEIDEPGWTYGDLFANFGASSLDNSNGVPSTAPDDVSMAMAWSFSLLADETAYISFLVSTTAPVSGFYLTQTDPDSDASLYFSSAMDIRGGGVPPVPEPSTLALMGLGLGLLGVWQTRRKHATSATAT